MSTLLSFSPRRWSQQDHTQLDFSFAELPKTAFVESPTKFLEAKKQFKTDDRNNNEIRRSVRQTLTSPPANSSLLGLSKSDVDSILDPENIAWPYKMKAELDGQIILGGLHMIHERNEAKTCGPIMAQGGIQAMETMLFTIDHINSQSWWIKNVTVGECVKLDFEWLWISRSRKSYL